MNDTVTKEEYKKAYNYALLATIRNEPSMG